MKHCPPRIRGSLLAVALTASALSAQCKKPKIPAGGLPTRAIVNQPATWSDGYKTLVNLTLPSTTTPSCGWPLVVFVHGYGGKRTIQRGIAKYGFAVATYDVRGQGDSRKLNPAKLGMTFYGAREKYDLAELIYFARTKWKGLVDPSKTAVTGGSQGGIHSWFAAAYSGQKITIAGRGSISFPKIDVVVPQNFIPDVHQHALRGDTLYSMDAMNRMLGFGGATLDPALIQQWKSNFALQDPLSLAKALHAEPFRDVVPLLLQSQVPIFAMHAYHDGINTAHELAHVVQQRRSKAPCQVLLSTIGHGSANNGYEFAIRNEMRLRAFDRFLWGIQNGIDKEAPWVLGVVPLPTSLYRNYGTLWQHRQDASYPAADVSMERHYLDSKGALVTSPPSAGNPTRIRHQVPSSFTPAVFASSSAQRSTANILKNIPLSQRLFSMPALAKERELGGSPKLSLLVTPDAERFTIAAFLTARIPGQSDHFILAHWARGVIGAKPKQAMRLDFELSPAVAVLPKGTVIELFVRNHWLRGSPYPVSLLTVPYFKSSNVLISHGAGAQASYIELPFRKALRVGLRANRATIPLAGRADLNLTVDAGAARAKRLYVILAGLSGQAPGIPLPGGTLPLRFDAVTALYLTLGSGPTTPGFIGVLDALGRAKATARFIPLLPLPTDLLNQRMSFATWCFDSPQSFRGAASNAVDLTFR